MPAGRPKLKTTMQQTDLFGHVAAAAAPKPGEKAEKLRLDQHLVLRDWVLHKLGFTYFTTLAGQKGLKQAAEADDLQGYTEAGRSRIIEMLATRQPDAGTDPLPPLQLYEIDERIKHHTDRINEARARAQQEPIRWLYFQYLSLLCTEVYLQHYFTDAVALLRSLLDFQQTWRQRNPKVQVADFEPADLNKLAIMQATGSGKTLLLHMHVLQLQYHIGRRPEVARHYNRIYLITPNEGLTDQHLEELRYAGLQAERFSKAQTGGLFNDGLQKIEVLEISKLKDEGKDKTVSYEALGRNNIVLIDEGHKDMGGEVRTLYREHLAAEGFAIEYSATFIQAIEAQKDKAKRQDLLGDYGKSVIFDYSYRYFHGDGYGKDFTVLNLEDDEERTARDKYMVGGLLKFYQQLCLYEGEPDLMREFRIERPLMLFVGGNVNGVRTEKKQQTSDITDILSFFRRFIRGEFAGYVGDALAGRLGIQDGKNRDVYRASDFNYLHNRFKEYRQGQTYTAQGLKAVYDDVLKRVFNCQVLGSELHLYNLKSAKGEIALKAGESERYFGLINVGDDAALLKLCQERHHNYSILDDAISASQFEQVKRSDSGIHFLVGAKKFMEGWSSYRVSSIGLMRIGSTEGSQIIQLFGRGVRLRGHNHNLKRSSALQALQLGADVSKLLRPVETLEITGIRANYMTEFKKLLEAEGVKPLNERAVVITIPVTLTKPEALDKLEVPVLKEGFSFVKDRPELVLAYRADLFRPPYELDFIPRARAMMADGAEPASQQKPTEMHLGKLHQDLLPWRKLHHQAIHYKNERGYHNLHITEKALKEILEKSDWYKVLLADNEPKTKLADFIALFERIAMQLLKRYIDRFYRSEQNRYEHEGERLELITLSALEQRRKRKGGKSLLPDSYQLEVELTDTHNEAWVKDLEENLAAAKTEDWEIDPYVFMVRNYHLFKPLVASGNKSIPPNLRLTPVPISHNEARFLTDLDTYMEAQYAGLQYQVLRNPAKRGISFATDADRYFPDFVVWLSQKGHSHILFVDPKGLGRQAIDGKVNLSYTIKKIAQKLRVQSNRADFEMHSFLVTETDLPSSPAFREVDPNQLANLGIFYMDAEREYVGKLLDQVLKA